MKYKKNSKKDYSNKLYFWEDRKDLRGTFPKWMMLVWAFFCFIGAIYLWQYSGIISIILVVAGWTFLSYLWNAKIWGKQK